MATAINKQVTAAVNNGQYAGDYSESGFFDKITSVIKSAGLQLIYEALQLYYVTENPNCPTKVKLAIFAALGYFISPIDAIPDFIPIAGYSDDGIAIAGALVLAHFYIDDEVKRKARNKIRNLFGQRALNELD